MNARWHAYGQLVRLPNLVTAAADSVAGFLFVGGALTDGKTLAGLAAASIGLYAGGVALNDVCDADLDAIARPDRPIPAGRIPHSRAGLLAFTLLMLGCAFAFLLTPTTGMIAAALAVSIVAYDAVLKSTALAAPAMGLCRALNLGLGLSVASGGVAPPQWLALTAMWLYVTSLTAFARHEATPNDSRWLRTATVGMTTAVLALAGLGALLANPYSFYYFPVAALAIVIAHRGRQAASENSPASVQRAVKTFVLAIVAFDACIVWSTRGALPAGLIAALLIPSALLSRNFRVT